MTCLSVVEQTKAKEPEFLYAAVENGMLTVLKIQNKAPDLHLTPSLELAYIAVIPTIRGYVLFKNNGFLLTGKETIIVNVCKL